MKKHVGIVLKRDSFGGDRFLLFDRYDGKVTCVAYGHDFASGALISYFIKKRVRINPCYITKVDLLSVPLAAARADIFFLHHVIELCTYSLAWQTCSRRAFDLVMLLYDSEYKLSNLLRKKVFLFKLLVSFGFHTDHDPFSVPLFHKLSSESIDRIVDSDLHLEIERSIDSWLFSCMRAHPKIENFKTVQFLKRIGRYEKM